MDEERMILTICFCQCYVSFSALTLLTGHQEGHLPIRKLPLSQNKKPRADRWIQVHLESSCWSGGRHRQIFLHSQAETFANNHRL